jgi:SAM-dependent methyltransferase
MSTARFMTPPAAEATGLAAEAAGMAPWFHNLHLPDGTQTAPNHALGDFPAFKWRQLAHHLPEDLGGWTALDIGCNAGFYSLELARRGAQVTGIDLDPHFLKQAQWAARQFDLDGRITFRQAQIYDLAHWQESFDLVLFMGVFYHLRYPMLGLDIVAERTRNLLVFQSLTMPGEDAVTPPEDQDFDDRSGLLEPAGQRWLSSRRIWRAIPPTGGFPIMRRSRPCCEARDLRLCRGRGMKSTSASRAVPEGRGVILVNSRLHAAAVQLNEVYEP